MNLKKDTFLRFILPIGILLEIFSITYGDSLRQPVERNLNKALRAACAEKLASTKVTESQKQAILYALNEARSKVDPPASNMAVLEWDDELEGLAQHWANQCKSGHGDMTDCGNTRIGQNVFQSGETTVNFQAAVDRWMEEKQWYHYTSSTCKAPPGRSCGHYTQVVWAKTTKVGCGYKICKGSYYPMNIVCNFAVAGNAYSIGTTYKKPKFQPYETGKSCSQCEMTAHSTKCKDKLCYRCIPSEDSECECSKNCRNAGVLDRKQCTCQCKPDTRGFLCEGSCLDDPTQASGCLMWKAQGKCTDKLYIEFMKKKCFKTCKFPCKMK